MTIKSALLSILLSFSTFYDANAEDDSTKTSADQEVKTESQSTKSGGGQRVGNGGPKSQTPESEEAKVDESTP